MKNSRSPAKQGKKPSSAWGKHLILDVYGVERKKLEVPIDNFEAGFFKKKIILLFYFLQKIINKEYMIWVIARK